VSKRTHTPASAAAGIEQAIRRLDGRWKLVILFHLFGGKTLRFSDLERAIPGISQKMLAQQLRQLEGDRIVTRTVHAEVPPKVEYRLTDWGQSLCPALDKLLTWAEQQPAPTNAEVSSAVPSGLGRDTHQDASAQQGLIAVAAGAPSSETHRLRESRASRRPSRKGPRNS
jgi:DNA-binding HxlR family transcriptional regulator